MIQIINSIFNYYLNEGGVVRYEINLLVADQCEESQLTVKNYKL